MCIILCIVWYLHKMCIILCIVWGFTEDIRHAVYYMGVYRRRTSYCVLYVIYGRCTSYCVLYLGFTEDIHHTVY